MKAWAVYCDGFESLSIVAAESRGRAIYLMYQGARDAGYNGVRWVDFACKRAERFDGLAVGDCYGYSLGWHAKTYSLSGDFTGYDNFGCLDGNRENPKALYRNLSLCEVRKEQP